MAGVKKEQTSDAVQKGSSSSSSKVKKGILKESLSERRKKIGFAEGTGHYVHQIRLISSVIQGPWTVCFGGLGTGIVGVRPPLMGEATYNLPDKINPLRKLKRELVQDAKVKQELKEEENDDEELPDGAKRLTDNTTIFLLVNSKLFIPQQRNGKALGDYADALDLEKGLFHWSSQHSDRRNMKLNTIIGHVARGNRLVIATRGGDIQDKLSFRVLGEVGETSDVKPYKFLVEDQEMVVQERGTDLHHKAIKAACLDAGLRSGIGLIGVKYRKSSFNGRFCSVCSYQPGSAVLHLKELNKAAADAFIKREEEEDVKKEEDDDEEKGDVKKEEEDEDEGGEEDEDGEGEEEGEEEETPEKEVVVKTEPGQDAALVDRRKIRIRSKMPLSAIVKIEDDADGENPAVPNDMIGTKCIAPVVKQEPMEVDAGEEAAV
mmetsp:Transcript_37505/g.81469  ORF Transcript_37505/g.81469 Transcript_37505/m.81469 type:complete len:433 (+) Transcript_37505:81-1379(+)|eukprot:CAMPEP_0206565908 /NCGR_PEP_ID=MMETSP0325_2-20121206/24360_1 /ASSEMBLY_ACC=CAM_ASM_000347 /TAXON_ID=2866 /ORGANISM="Crypthecodinium cohnii, Strain Seligo" /LENGTH=432 /DNA_ID=CAMNT_0054068871 /DNA_START=69 /DNA_END=1367 /DNA_ORIENTATION=+